MLYLTLLLIQNSLTCLDADKNLENLGMVYQHSMEELASQGLIIVGFLIHFHSFYF